MREISEKECGVLKGATYRSLKQAGGGGNVQHSTRVNESTLSKYHSNDEKNAQAFVPLDIAVEIDRLAGHPIILETYAEMLGYRIVPKDGEAEAGNGPVSLDELVRSALVLFNEAGDVGRAVALGVEDGHLDNAERSNIVKEIEEVKKHANTLLKLTGRAK